MTAGHVGKVRLETGRITTNPTFLLRQKSMRQIAGNILECFLKNNFIFLLHPQKQDDINP